MQATTTQGMSVKTAKRLLCAAVALMLISCLGASALQTAFGAVRITGFTIPTGSGKWITGDLFEPVDASPEAPVPLVITCPGYLNNKEIRDSTAIELSRRGIAVMAIDPYFHGESSFSQLSVIDSTIQEGVGLVPMVEFASQNLSQVDSSRIGIMGHSMGGMAVWMTLAQYGGKYYEAIGAARDPGSPGGEAGSRRSRLMPIPSTR